MKPEEIRPGMRVVLMSSSHVMTVAKISDWRAFWGRPYVLCTYWTIYVNRNQEYGDFAKTWRYPEELGAPASDSQPTKKEDEA